MDKRRKFTPQFKAKVVLELLSGAKTPAQACREYGLRDSLVYKWRGEFLERAYTVFADKGNHQDEYETRIAELERMVGRLTVELDATKKAWQLVSFPGKGNGRSPAC